MNSFHDDVCRGLTLCGAKHYMSDICSYLCCGLYSADAAAVAKPEPAGFGPEGIPGTHGGACTGDFTDITCFPTIQIIILTSYTSVIKVRWRHFTCEMTHAKEFV